MDRLIQQFPGTSRPRHASGVGGGGVRWVRVRVGSDADRVETVFFLLEGRCFVQGVGWVFGV